MFRKVCLAVLCVSFAISSLALVKGRAEQYLNSVSVSAAMVEPACLQISLKNSNKAHEAYLHTPVMGRYYIAVPTEKLPEIVLGDYEVEVYQDRKRIESFTNRTAEPDFPLPGQSSFIRYKYVGQFRNIRLARLELVPIMSRSTGKKPALLVFTTLTFKLQFPYLPKEAEAAERDLLTEKILSHVVLNADCFEHFADRSPKGLSELLVAKAWADKVNDALTSGPVLKIVVEQPGVYELNYYELRKAGIEPDILRPDRLKLYHDGKEIPIVVEAKLTNTFSHDDRIYFYTLPFDHTKRPQDSYWLLTETKESVPAPKRLKPIVNYDIRLASPEVITTGMATVEQFKRQFYYHRLIQPFYLDRWYWEEIAVGHFKEFTFELEAISFDEKAFDLTCYFAGKEQRKTNYCAIYLNGALVNSIEWRPLQNYKYEEKVPVSYLRNGLNRLAIYVPETENEDLAPNIVFKGFTVTYVRQLKSEKNALSVTIKPPVSGSPYRFFLSGFSPRETLIFNVTDPQSPILYEPSSYYHDKKAGIIWVDQIAGEARYEVVGSDSAKLPVAIQRIAPIEICQQNNRVDYLIITHPRFLEALKPFVEARRQQGLCVHTATVDEIYNAFNYGNKDARAIRKFLKYVYSQWASPRLTYVLLVGESSDYVGPPSELPADAQEDLVPVMGFGDTTVTVRADNQYATVSGDDDLPDLLLGRFSVNTAEELTGIIEKTLSYKQSSNVGEWGNQHLFVTDDEPEFARIANNVIEDTFPISAETIRLFQQNFPYSNFYRIWQRKRSRAATEALIQQINDGVVIMNYFGHGGPNIWSGERLFHFKEVEGLHNRMAPIFLTCSTCDTAWLDYPVGAIRSSLAERFLKHKEGAAIGVYGPSTGASSSDHEILVRTLYEGFFDLGLRRMGELTLYSKVHYALEKGNKHVIDQFLLLGDPWLSLSPPRKSFSLKVTPGVVNQETSATLHITGAWKTPFWGQAKVMLRRGTEEDATVLADKVRVFNGHMSYEHELPTGLPEGRYTILAYACNFPEEYDGLATADFEVVKPKLALDVSYSPLPDPCFQPNKRVTFDFTLMNESKVALPEVSLRVTNPEFPDPILAKTFPLDPKEKQTFSLGWNSTPGFHHLIIEARHSKQTKESNGVTKHLFLPVRVPRQQAVLVAHPDEITPVPKPLYTDSLPEFVVHLYNLGDRAAENVYCGLQLGDVVILGAIEKIERLDPQSSRELRFQTIIPFPQGRFGLKFFVKTYEASTDDYITILEVPTFVTVLAMPDLTVDPESIKFHSNQFLNGETIFITATVRNIGSRAAEGFLVEAFESVPWDRTKIASSFYHAPNLYIDRLGPGEETEMTIRWDRFGLPGDYTVYVIANSTKTIKEADYANNMASRMVHIKKQGNIEIALQDVQTSSKAIRRGDEVNITYTIRNTGDLDVGPFEVIMEEQAPNERKRPYGPPIEIKLIKAHEEITQSVLWKIDSYKNVFSVSANAEKEIDELNYGDNSIDIVFDYICGLHDLDPVGKEQYSCRTLFPLGRKEMVQVNPALEVYPTSLRNASGHVIDVDPRYAPRYEAPTATEADPLHDNRWHFATKWLESSPYENAQPITLSIPLPEEDQTSLYDVYIYVQTNRNYKGYQASKIRLKIEDEKDFQLYSYIDDKLPWKTVKYYLGRYDVHDHYFDVTIDDVEDNYWTVVHHFSFVPVKAKFTSPIVDLGRIKKRSVRLAFRAYETRPPGTAVRYRVRFGTVKGKGVSWQPWEQVPLNEKRESAELPPKGQLVQWEAELFLSPTQYPVIKDFHIAMSRTGTGAVHAGNSIYGIEDLEALSSSRYGYQTLFPRGNTELVEVSPALEIYAASLQNVPGHLIDVDPKYAVDEIHQLPEDNRLYDDLWHFEAKWLEASPHEKLEPISLSIPLPEEDGTTVYDVYIYTQTDWNYKGYPASKVRLKIENEEEFYPHDFSTDELPWKTVKYYLGRYDLRDRFFDVTIGTAEGNYWVIVNHFEFVPAKGKFISPVVDFSALRQRGTRVAFRAEETRPPGTAVRYRVRFGAVKQEGVFVSWQPWEELQLNEERESAEMLPKGHLVQWEAELLLSPVAHPVIRDFQMKIH